MQRERIPLIACGEERLERGVAPATGRIWATVRRQKTYIREIRLQSKHNVYTQIKVNGYTLKGSNSAIFILYTFSMRLNS